MIDMNNPNQKSSAIGVAGAVIGFPVGGALGGYAVQYGGPMVYGPEFGQIAWLIVMFAVPAGAIAGAVLGVWTIVARPRLFFATFVPVGIVVLVHQFILDAAQEREENTLRNYVLRVSGSAAADFVGVVRVDGEIHKLKGKLPSDFEYSGLEIEFAFALVNRWAGDEITVETIVNGKKTKGGRGESRTGVHERYDTLGASRGSYDMPPKDLQNLIRNHTMPPW